MTEDELQNIIKLNANKYEKEVEKYEALLGQDLGKILSSEDVTIDLNNAISEKVAHLARPVPSMVPQLLECTQMQFMELPIEHFLALCEKHTYNRVISSLTYIQNITSNGEKIILERVSFLKDQLKNSRTNHVQQNRNKVDDRIAPEDNTDKS